MRHFKAVQLHTHTHSSLKPVWCGVSLTSIVKPVQLLSWSQFPPQALIPGPPSEEHMSPITVLLSQQTIKAQCQSP